MPEWTFSAAYPTDRKKFATTLPIDEVQCNYIVAPRSTGDMPVKLGLAGDQSLVIFVDGYPKTQPIDCDSTDPVSPHPLRVVSCQASDLLARQGPGKRVSAFFLALKPLFIILTIGDKVEI